MSLRTVFIMFLILEAALFFAQVSFLWTLAYFLLGFVDGQYLFVSSLFSILASLLSSYVRDLWLTFNELLLEYIDRMEREKSNE